MKTTTHLFLALAPVFLAAAVTPQGAQVASAGEVKPASSASPLIPLPRIPSRVFRVADFGARGDGKQLDTLALQKAINACSEAGGGVVDVPEGDFLTGPLTLASNLELRLERGATLRLSDDPANYPLKNNAFGNCITATGCHDVAITGDGTIEGQGKKWWDHYVQPKDKEVPALPHRPFLVVLTRCERVRVQGVHLQNSPSFHLVPGECRDVTVDGISIAAPADSHNTDGIDPSGWNFLIQGCTIDVGDDNIALKPSRLTKDGAPSCENFLIQNCRFLHGHGLSIGGQTRGALKNMTVRNCTFEGTQAGIRLKAPRGAGGLVEDVSYSHLAMNNVKVPILITSYYPRIPKDPMTDAGQPLDSLTPVWKNIRISNVSAQNSQTAGQIIGLPEAPVEGVSLDNVQISATKPFQIFRARDVRFVHCSISVAKGAAFQTGDAQVSGLDLLSGR